MYLLSTFIRVHMWCKVVYVSCAICVYARTISYHRKMFLIVLYVGYLFSSIPCFGRTFRRPSTASLLWYRDWLVFVSHPNHVSFHLIWEDKKGRTQKQHVLLEFMNVLSYNVKNEDLHYAHASFYKIKFNA